jgi:uncharacterized protein
MWNDVQEARWRTIVIFYCVHGVLLMILVFGAFNGGWFKPVAASTAGLINETLIANLLLLFICVYGIVMRMGKLKLTDIGLTQSKLWQGFALTVLLWVLMQALALISQLFAAGEAHLHPLWSGKSAYALIGAFAGQLLGNALFEETGYRGFLLSQLYMKLGARWKERPRLCIALAAFLSSFLFSITHIPIRLYQGASIAELPLLLILLILLGVFFAIIYLRTRNLIFAVGVHSLMNQPIPLFDTTIGFLNGQLPVILIAIAILLLFPRMVRNSFSVSNPV